MNAPTYLVKKTKGVPIYVIEVHALKCRWRIPTTKNFISAKDSTDSTDSTDLKIKKFNLEFFFFKYLHCQDESGNFCTSKIWLNFFQKIFRCPQYSGTLFWEACFAMLSSKYAILHPGNNIFKPLPPNSMLTRTLNIAPIDEVWTNSFNHEHVIKCPFS